MISLHRMANNETLGKDGTDCCPAGTGKMVVQFGHHAHLFFGFYVPQEGHLTPAVTLLDDGHDLFESRYTKSKHLHTKFIPVNFFLGAII